LHKGKPHRERRREGFERNLKGMMWKKGKQKEQYTHIGVEENHQ
jgi:hypothetical protein